MPSCQFLLLNAYSDVTAIKFISSLQPQTYYYEEIALKISKLVKYMYTVTELYDPKKVQI